MNTNSLEIFGESVPVGSKSQCGTVLCRFQFTNPKHIPEGIPEKVRLSDEEMDKHHIKKAYEYGYGGATKLGDIREGRWCDAGQDGYFINNLGDVQPGFLVKGLSNLNYHTADMHWFSKDTASGYGKKFVVVIDLKLGVEPAKFPQGAIQQRRILSATCWRWLHGYNNHNGTVTLNFVGRNPDKQPQNTVVVRDSHLTAARINFTMTENHE